MFTEYVMWIMWQIASEGLKHRVFEISLADLQNDEDHAYRKIRLRAEDVQGKNVLTNFWVGIAWQLAFFFLITCKRGKLGFLIFFNNFREWTLQQTSWGLWCASGRHWLRLMWMLRQQITTPWGCSALHSQRSVKTRTRRLHMPNPVRSVRFSWNSIQLLSFPCGLTLQWCW